MGMKQVRASALSRQPLTSIVFLDRRSETLG